AVQLQTNLNTIPALAGNVQVAQGTGTAANTYTITFTNGLTGTAVSALATNPTLGLNATIATTTPGSTPTAGNVQSSLNTIPALNGNVSVAGPTNGVYTVTFTNNLFGLNVQPLSVVASGGVTAVAATTRDGGINSATDLLTALNTIPALAGNV